MQILSGYNGQDMCVGRNNFVISSLHNPISRILSPCALFWYWGQKEKVYRFTVIAMVHLDGA